MANQKLIDTSNEFHVYGYRNGVCFVRPNEVVLQNRVVGQNRATLLANVLELPFNVYFLDHESLTQNMNEANAATMGWESIKSSLGKSVSCIATKKSAQYILNINKNIINSGEIKIVEENIIRKDHIDVQRLSIKMPWYNANKNIVGLFGFSIVIGKQPLADSLSKIMHLGLLSPNNFNAYSKDILSSSKNYDIYLSKREMEILHYVVRGKPARIIAQQFQISPRTVEQHIENIKNKMGVVSKAELIEKVIDNFL